MFIHTSLKLDVAFVKTKQNVNVYAVYLIKLSIFQSPELSWISLDPKYIPFLQPGRYLGHTEIFKKLLLEEADA